MGVIRVCTSMLENARKRQKTCRCIYLVMLTCAESGHVMWISCGYHVWIRQEADIIIMTNMPGKIVFRAVSLGG